jgi:hypothetical protein
MSVRYVVDTGVPFLAVRREVDGGYFRPTNAVYLVNPLSVALCNVKVSTGGHYSDVDLGVTTVEGKEKPSLDLAALSAAKIEMTSDDEFDEVNIWWTVCFEVDGITTTRDFATSKRLENVQSVDEVPVLGKPGKLIPQSISNF